MSDESRRRAILLAADQLLVHYGVRKTTIADIAREADIGVGTVYLEFSSKSVIVRELADERHAAALEAMREAGAADETFAERLRAVIDARVRHLLAMTERGAHAAELVHCSDCRPVIEAWERFRDRERALIVELLEAGDRDGEFDVHDPEATAEALLAIYARFTPPQLFERSPDWNTALLDEVHRVALQGLLRR